MKLSFQNLLMYNNKEIYVSQTLLFHLSKYNNIKILSYQIFIAAIFKESYYSYFALAKHAPINGYRSLIPDFLSLVIIIHQNRPGQLIDINIKIHFILAKSK